MKFSVVIAAYNVENYIGSLLQCLLGQTYSDFEVIVVDDCATDGTAKLVDEFADEFASKSIPYQVIHKPVNEGLSMARNTGLESAKGEYVLFWDGDDLVEDNALEVIAGALDGRTVDFIVYGYTEDYYKGDEVSYRVEKSPGNYFAKPLVHAFPYITKLEQQTMFGYAWNKVFRREFLVEHNLRYETITHVEDILFNLQVAERMESMLCIEDNLYHYINRGQERLTSKYLPEYFDLQKKRFRAFLALQNQKIQWAKETNQPISQEEIATWQQQVMETMAAAYFRTFQSAITREINHGTSKKDILAMAEREQNEPLYQQLRDHLNTESKMAKTLYAPLANGDFAKAYSRGKLICFVQKHFAGLFAKLKQHR
ncbi:MAG: glycosyltransferase family 2 protein [Lachnospiraceae bacterium]|nr:glycosyltransferase family 2 protein [Lachnospiraceae bacterium]